MQSSAQFPLSIPDDSAAPAGTNWLVSIEGNTITEKIKGDGQQSIWTLSYPIERIISVSIVKEDGSYSERLYTAANDLTRFASDSHRVQFGVTLPYGALVTITYDAKPEALNV